MNPFTGLCALVFTLLGPVIAVAGVCVLIGATGPVGLWIGAVVMAAVVAVYSRGKP